MDLQKWPGSGTARIGYGVPGGISWDKHLKPITARQHETGGFVNGGTKKLYEPLGIVNRFGEHGNRRLHAIKTFADSIDLGGVDLGLLKVHAFESEVLTSPAVLNPLLGRRISSMHPNSSICAYADDNFVSYFDTTKNNEIQVRINLCSPVLQIDRHGLVRTYRGIAATQPDGRAEYFAEGDFMHASSVSSAEEMDDVVASNASGTVLLYDSNVGKCKWEQELPKGSIGGWNRVIGGMGGSPHIGIWCNRYIMATMDFREPPKAQRGLAAGSHVVINFEDRQRQIREMDGGVDNKEVFALTSYEMVWVSDQGKSQALSVEHAVAASDYSVSLYKGKHRDHNLVTITSQLMPTTLANVFGQTDGLPTLLDDTYFIDAWPTIIPQSHITVENATGTSIYSIGSQGGLYRQQWNETNIGESLDDIIDVPEPDPEVKLSQSDLEHIQKDDISRVKAFDLLNNWASSFTYNFEKLYDFAFEPLGADFDNNNNNHHHHHHQQLQQHYQDHPLNSTSNLPMHHVDAENIDAFREYCVQAWILPVKKRAEADPAAVSTEAIVERERDVNKIVSDMTEVGRYYQNKLNSWESPSAAAAAAATLAPEIREILQQWSDDEEKEQESMISQEIESSQFANSQPTQLHTQHINDLMSSETDAQFSQPVPTLRSSSKRKHKHKTKKHRKHGRLTQ